MYETLNDAGALIPALAAGSTKVWYMRPAQWSQRRDFDPRNPEATHILLGSVASRSPDVIFTSLQGERWSPEGEARQLIWNMGLRHTSMSVGDVVEIDGRFHIAAFVGWIVKGGEPERGSRA